MTVMKIGSDGLYLKNLGIDTYKNAVIFMPKNCEVCKSEGYEVHTRVRVTLNNRNILATLNTMDNDILKNGQVSLSEYA